MNIPELSTPAGRNNMKSKFLISLRSAVIVAAILGILLFKQATLAYEGVVIAVAVFAVLSSAFYMSKEEIKSNLKVLFVAVAVAIAYIVIGVTRF